jgi:hypothetical protein
MPLKFTCVAISRLDFEQGIHIRGYQAIFELEKDEDRN